ncbi:MAG: PilN domain-containing protein [Fimbriimonadales bacterium]|jgi:hypothetical protein|nr:PilN domain-containing protein [Fimbriimonadales bacterium]GBC90355.1 hypothetical protein HRbin14_01090 [bacterium HR14]GIV13506.1 MAG: hypothetical protein KatS3mg021_1788 [Fimbriimonadales bacterium]CUU05647.1 Tfp pilus assembly protein PilN [Armatimonadetes bacterium GBS]CUU36211.1 Tfp pilus assembly protein PilN [Armatimonadetes bacterium GXS]
MSVINLIAQDRLKRQQLARKVRLAGLAWFGVVVLVAVGWGGAILYVGALSLQTARIEEEMVRLNPTVQALKQVQAQLNALQPTVTTLQNARTETGRARKLLQHLSQHTPAGCYLSAIEFGKRSDPKKPMEVVLRGTADKQETVGELMLRLNQHPDLEKVRLDFSQERTLGETQSAFDFQITAEIKGTAIQTKEEKKDGGQQ